MTEYLSSSDAFMWAIGDDPVLHSTIVTLTMLERCPDWHEVVDRFNRISLAAPRFRQIVKRSTPPLPPHWELDPEFDLGFHVRRERAPEPGNLDVLLERVQIAAMADYDRAHPLWEATLVDGLADGAAALLCKLDHAMTDGVGAIQLASVLYDCIEPSEQSVPSGPETSHVGAPPSALIQARRLLVRSVRHPVAAAAAACTTAASMVRTARPMNGPQSRLMVKRSPRRHVGTHEVSKAELLRAAHAAGGTLNDALIAAIAGGLRRYHENHAAPVAELLVSMPISIRTGNDPAGGNRATLSRFRVPVDLTDPGSRIRAIHEHAGIARSEKALAHTSAIAAVLNAMPRRYVTSALRHVDFIASDVPGFPKPVSLAGAPVRMQYAFSPTLGAALNVTMFSYVDTCGIGVNVDIGAIPDYHAFHGCLVEGFDEVLNLAMR